MRQHHAEHEWPRNGGSAANNSLLTAAAAVIRRKMKHKILKMVARCKGGCNGVKEQNVLAGNVAKERLLFAVAYENVLNCSER